MKLSAPLIRPQGDYNTHYIIMLREQHGLSRPRYKSNDPAHMGNARTKMNQYQNSVRYSAYMAVYKLYMTCGSHRELIYISHIHYYISISPCDKYF